MLVFLSQLINGISVASILLITALGLGIIFGLMKVINMAHGELIMIGAYSAYLFVTVLKQNFFVGMIAAFFITGLVGLLVELIVIKKLYGQPTETLLATFGLSIVLQQIIRSIFGPELRYVSTQFNNSINFGDSITIPVFRIFIFIMTVFMLFVTWFMFYKTSFGKKIRAITQNRDMTECLGINTSKVDTWTFAYGAGLAGLAGAIMAPIKSVSPTMGLQYLTDSFMTVVIGGVNSLAGTAIGATLVGESTTTLGWLSNEIFAKIIVFLMIIIFIRFKPEGLFSNERR